MESRSALFTDGPVVVPFIFRSLAQDTPHLTRTPASTTTPIVMDGKTAAEFLPPDLTCLHSPALAVRQGRGENSQMMGREDGAGAGGRDQSRRGEGGMGREEGEQERPDV